MDKTLVAAIMLSIGAFKPCKCENGSVVTLLHSRRWIGAVTGRFKRRAYSLTWGICDLHGSESASPHYEPGRWRSQHGVWRRWVVGFLTKWYSLQEKYRLREQET
jgi:hypothetical protein